MKSTREYASHDAAIIRGHCWHVYPDLATPGVMAGDNPFGTDEAPGPGRDEPAHKPDGVLNFWLVDKNAPGLLNFHEGHSYLVLTEALEPPRVTAGWAVEAARLTDDFQLDQRGDRWVRLVRIIGSIDTIYGLVPDCEFQVDRT